MNALLERVPLIVPEVDEEMDAKFISEVSEHLGYHQIQSEREGRKELKAIVLAFDKLAIIPFDSAKVEKYKAEAAQIAEFRWIDFVCLSWFGISFITMMSSFLGLIATIWVFAFLRGSFAVGLVIGLISTIGSSWSLAMIANSRKSAMWRKHPLSDYNKPVPEFVLQTALDLKKLLPECTLFIDEMTVEDRVVDPFLGVRLGGQEWYVEVWNELGFKVKRGL